MPELVPWAGEDRDPDISIRLGAVPCQLDDLVHQGPFLQIDTRGFCLLILEDVASYLVPDESTVIVATRPDAPAADIRLFLLGSVLGFLCHKRGPFPLHASCLAIDDGAVAFSGPSGAGKSTTAIHFARRGHRLLTDDICAIDVAPSDGPRVLPTFPRTKLWRDSMDSADLNGEGLDRIRSGRDKYDYRPPGVFLTDPVPLRAVFLLEKAEPDQLDGIVRLTHPVKIISALSAETYRPQAATALGRERALFTAQAKIAASVPVYRLTRPYDFARMDAWMEAVEATVRG
ncbi:MAG: hypothetical protein Q8L23_11325 [Caulobacter sp.]|nr:hypothetical protein [Caulobacter sp.]